MKLSVPLQVYKEKSLGALFVVNHSGGKDSQAMMIKLREFVPANQLLVIHASLGILEWAGALELAQNQAVTNGSPFIVARAKRTLVDMALDRYSSRPEVPSFPSAKNRQCTSDLKRSPITREVRAFAKANGFTSIINCMGMRAQESSSRAKKQTFKPHQEHGRAGRSWYDWLPIHNFTEEDVYQTISKAGEKPHWAYTTGNERLSCVYCIMSSKNDLSNGALHNAPLYALYCFLEKYTGYTMHMSRKSLPEITGITPDYSLLNEYPEILAKVKSIPTTRQHIPILTI